MNQYVSIDKRSKKAQKEYYSGQRRTWNGLNPVTRTAPNGKAYNRNKDKQERRRIGKESGDGFAADSCLAMPMLFRYVIVFGQLFGVEMLLFGNGSFEQGRVIPDQIPGMPNSRRLIHKSS